MAQPSTEIRVLFVDDDCGARQMFARTLRRGGHDVVLASDGEQALALLRHRSFDVIVTDLFMPGIGGLELAARVGESTPGTPLVVVTGDTTVDLSAEAVGLTNIAALLFKPWNRHELSATLARVIAAKVVERAPEPATLRLLLVDADDAAAEAVVRSLGRSSLAAHTVERARCVRDAVRRLESERFAAVLLDLELPDATGDDAIHRVREAVGHVPIIALGATDDDALAASAVHAGAQDYLAARQLDSSLLARSVRHALERQRADQRLAHLALHDQLTGLVNRSVFHERLARTLARCRRMKLETALFFVDLDQFKRVNDVLGHAAGDDVLREIGAALRSTVRDFETVARLGGDEFAIAVEEIQGKRGAAVIAQRLLDVVRDTIQHQAAGFYVGASIGVAMFPDNGDTVDRLLQSAASAMYRAKPSGHGFQFFSREMHEMESRRHRVEEIVRSAACDGSFRLEYQPLFATASRRLTGVEALLRLDAELPLSPAEFVPVLETTRLIEPIGAWAVHAACEQGRRWIDQRGIPLRLAVNLSPCQFRGGNLARHVREALEDTGFPAAWLELEITESMLMEDRRVAAELLIELKAELGVRFALDDFGTGCSSLAYLHSFPIDVLKIDQLFIHAVADPAGASLCRGIVALGHSLGLEVTAEGVETEAQLALMGEFACDMVQGYLLARPARPEALASTITPAPH